MTITPIIHPVRKQLAFWIGSSITLGIIAAEAWYHLEKVPRTKRRDEFSEELRLKKIAQAQSGVTAQ